MNQPRQDQTDDIDVFDELSPDHKSRDHSARVAGDNPLSYDDLLPVCAEGPTIDDEVTISEVVIRERLIEWLVGFLPGGPRADQAQLCPQCSPWSLQDRDRGATPSGDMSS
jgi:hypothetical protein